MKITLDIPNTTLCASVALVFVTKSGMSMSSTIIDTNDLRTKSEIKIKGDEQTEQGEC